MLRVAEHLLAEGRIGRKKGGAPKYATQEELDRVFGMTSAQKREQRLRVRDPDGAEGWVNQSLLSGRRTAIAAPCRGSRV